jgi:hypothetical protein
MGLNTLMRALGTSVAAAVVAMVLAGSAVAFGDTFVPSRTGFHASLVCGLIAAVACAVIAALIPKPTPHPAEEPSLPDGVL